MTNFWTIVGVVVLGWVAWDLYAGYTFLYNMIYRNEQPALYWTMIAVWTAAGLSCFYGSN